MGVTNRDFSFIKVFSMCYGSPCVEVARVGVAFHLVNITIRMQETLPLLKEKCQGFDSFLESKMV